MKRKIASVKAYYSYLEENELIKESPFRKIKVKFKENLILPRIIPREEIEHLLNHMYGLSLIHIYGLHGAILLHLHDKTAMCPIILLL